MSIFTSHLQETWMRRWRRPTIMDGRHVHGAHCRCAHRMVGQQLAANAVIRCKVQIIYRGKYTRTNRNRLMNYCVCGGQDVLKLMEGRAKVGGWAMFWRRKEMLEYIFIDSLINVLFCAQTNKNCEKKDRKQMNAMKQGELKQWGIMAIRSACFRTHVTRTSQSDR